MVDSKRTVADVRKKLDFGNYTKLLKIEDRRTGELVPLELNSVQKKVRYEIAVRLRDKVPVRLIILKSRRMGVSTVIQASFAHLAFTTARFQAVTGAHEDESSQYLHGMTEQMYDNLPPGELKPVKKTGLRGRKMGFITGSGMRTFTAGNRSSALRGQGTRAIHCSEVAFWPDIQGTLLAARQIVPNEPGTMVILESTAFGRNQFHQEWLRAKAGLSGYTPLFYAWFEFAEYRVPLPPGGLINVPAEPDWIVDEPALRAMGCDDEQLAWRRRTIANEAGGSLDQFHQEYPATDHEAFLASGRPFFKNLERFIPVPERKRGWFVGDPVPGKRLGKMPITFVPDAAGLVKIWDPPEPGVKYAIWADVAGSVILDAYDARQKVDKGTGTDAYAAYVISLRDGKTVAGLHGRVADEKVWAWELARIGRIYATDGVPALIAVEKQGGYGIATNIYLRDELSYPNLWRDLDFDSEFKQDEALAIGWQTSVTTRPQMLAELDAVLREDPARLRDDGLKDEMSAFIYNSKGKPEADVGYHDDRVMAAAGCARIFQLRAQPLRAPKQTSSAPQSIISRAPRVDRSSLN